MAKGYRVSISDAKRRFSLLIDRALKGDDVVITRYGQPVARLVPARAPRRLGTLRGKIRVAPDFDAPLSSDFLLGGSGAWRR